MTKRLYLEDPYVTSFEAEIVDTRESDDGLAVIFAETYFYPESGGQPFDLGTIDGIPVTRVLEDEDDAVLHFVAQAPRGPRVSCVIDGERRRDHMQQHAGQHILSAAFVSEANAQTTSFHLGANVSTIDLDHPDLTTDDVQRAVRAANDVVGRAVPIRSRFVTGDEARSLELRKPPPEGERLRIVEVEGFDHQACCGTHPRSSGEVGPIVARGFERFKGGTRIEFLCGQRALDDYRVTIERIRSLASVLSSSEEALVDTAETLQAERKSLRKELAKLKREALVAEAASWMDDAITVGPLTVLAKTADELPPSELRELAQRLADHPRRVVLLGSVAGGRAHLVFARSSDVDADMGKLLAAAVGAVDGRGGGSPEIAQGGGAKTDGLARALETACRLLVP